MAERVEPVIQVTIEGKGWDGEEYHLSGCPANTVIFPENSRQIIEPLRAHIAEKLAYAVAQASLIVEHFDFVAPTMPTREEVDGLVSVLDKASGYAAVLREMSPEEFSKDEEEPSSPDLSEPVK